MLLFLEHKDAHGVDDVILPDGRGGDGGVDVGIMSAGEYLHIYQLKFFPQGFGGHRTAARKKQIRESFQKAIEGRENLRHWTLVMPAKFTPGELAFVRSLARGSRPRVHTMGPREMDALLASHPQLIEQMNRAPIIEALAMMHAEDAALTTPRDLRRRVAKVGARADAASSHWSRNFSYENGQTIVALKAKHSRAHELEPLAIRFNVDHAAASAEVRQAFAKHLNYGSERKVRVPVSTFEQIGPEWFAEKSDGGELIVERPPLDPADQLPFIVHVIDEHGFTTGSHNGRLTANGRGLLGITLEANFSGAVEMQVVAPYDRTAAGSLTFRSEFQGLPISDVSKGRALLRALQSKSRMRFQLGDLNLFEMGVSDGSDFVLDGEFDELVDDLEIIWRETGIDFQFPLSLTNLERITIRICRMIYSGKVALLAPGASIPINLNDGVELPTEPVQVFARIPRQPMEILGHRINVGPVTIYCPSTEWTADSQSFAKQRTGRVTPTPGCGIRVFREGNPDQTIQPEPWLLPQIPEHPELAHE